MRTKKDARLASRRRTLCTIAFWTFPRRFDNEGRNAGHLLFRHLKLTCSAIASEVMVPIGAFKLSLSKERLGCGHHAAAIICWPEMRFFRTLHLRKRWLAGTSGASGAVFATPRLVTIHILPKWPVRGVLGMKIRECAHTLPSGATSSASLSYGDLD